MTRRTLLWAVSLVAAALVLGLASVAQARELTYVGQPWPNGPDEARICVNSEVGVTACRVTVEMTADPPLPAGLYWECVWLELHDLNDYPVDDHIIARYVADYRGTGRVSDDLFDWDVAPQPGYTIWLNGLVFFAPDDTVRAEWFWQGQPL